MNFVLGLTRSHYLIKLWAPGLAHHRVSRLSSKVSERGIRRCEIRFCVGDSEFFSVPRS